MRDRQRQTHRETETQRDRDTERQRQRETDRESDQINKHQSLFSYAAVFGRKAVSRIRINL